MNQKRHVRSFLTLITAATFFGCSTEEPLRPGRPPREFPNYTQQDRSPRTPSTRLPFETWSPHRDLEGGSLSNRNILLGDELYEKGDRLGALKAYTDALASAGLSDTERAAAVLRTASLQLSVDQSQRALKTASDFFRTRGYTVDQVDLPFAILLAYGYGRKGDLEQSFAWFSRVNRLSNGKGYAADSARLGTTLLLRTLPTPTFESTAQNWRTDDFINTMIGRERSRRSSRGYVEVSWDPKQPFWMVEEKTPQKIDIAPLPPSTAPAIGLLATLTDRMSSLGKSTKEGVELAVAADTSVPPVKLEVRDVGSTNEAAAAAVRELSASVQTIVGPLLNDPSVAAADTARELNVPLVSLSKSETFKTGQGVFRLGATTASQVDALVNSAYQRYEITRFGAVYPTSASGQEALRMFKDKLAQLNLTLVFETGYISSDESSLFQAAQEIERQDVQAVFLPDDLTAAGKLLSNLSVTIRKRTRPLGLATWDNPTRIANSQAVFEGALFVSLFFSESQRPVVRQFVDSYKGKFGTAPNFLAAQGFDAATLVITALRKSQAEGTAFREALTHLPPYDGVTGAISISGGGEFNRVFKVIEVLKEGFGEVPDPGGIVPHQEKIVMRGNDRIPVKEGEDQSGF